MSHSISVSKGSSTLSNEEHIQEQKTLTKNRPAKVSEQETEQIQKSENDDNFITGVCQLGSPSIQSISNISNTDTNTTKKTSWPVKSCTSDVENVFLTDISKLHSAHKPLYQLNPDILNASTPSRNDTADLSVTLNYDIDLSSVACDESDNNLSVDFFLDPVTKEMVFCDSPTGNITDTETVINFDDSNLYTHENSNYPFKYPKFQYDFHETNTSNLIYQSYNMVILKNHHEFLEELEDSNTVLRITSDSKANIEKIPQTKISLELYEYLSPLSHLNCSSCNTPVSPIYESNRYPFYTHTDNKQSIDSNDINNNMRQVISQDKIEHLEDKIKPIRPILLPSLTVDPNDICSLNSLHLDSRDSVYYNTSHFPNNTINNEGYFSNDDFNDRHFNIFPNEYFNSDEKHLFHITSHLNVVERDIIMSHSSIYTKFIKYCRNCIFKD